ncbi:MAG: V-type ATP synthase subunit K [Clostridia bacterium]|nr:V-type ATP synthase subunit K [Clostridia bacterium]
MTWGTIIALTGAVIAALLACIGSARGVGIACEAGNAVVAEDPTKAGKALLLEALPGSQGIYGFVTAFMVLMNVGVIGGSIAQLTMAQGWYLFISCLPIAIVGYFSAVFQGKVCATGMNILAKKPDDSIKGVTAAALVETYAIFSLLVSLLLILNF